jgi:predicted transposase/invertase (TIGR01784 family)
MKKVKTLIPLTYDFMFKRVFTQNPNLLKELLISILQLELNPDTSEIIIENTELPKSTKKEYRKTVDILVTINNTKIIDVELNSSSFNEIKYRNTLYIEKVATNKIESGINYQDMSNYYFYQLNLNIHKFKDNTGEKMFTMKDDKTNELLLDNLKIIYKSLDYYTKLYYTNNRNVSKDVIWLALINTKTFDELEEMSKLVMREKDRNKFLKDVKNASQDKLILSEWEADKMAELVKEETIKYAKLEGIEKGIEQGIEQGIEKGIEQGTKDMIRNLLKANIPIEDIARATGKSIKELKEISQTNN